MMCRRLQNTTVWQSFLHSVLSLLLSGTITHALLIHLLLSVQCEYEVCALWCSGKRFSYFWKLRVRTPENSNILHSAHQVQNPLWCCSDNLCQIAHRSLIQLRTCLIQRHSNRIVDVNPSGQGLAAPPSPRRWVSARRAADGWSRVGSDAWKVRGSSELNADGRSVRTTGMLIPKVL